MSTMGLTAVCEDSLVTQFVEDRTHHRSSRAHEVGQLLLCQAKMWPKTVLAAGGNAS